MTPSTPATGPDEWQEQADARRVARDSAVTPLRKDATPATDEPRDDTLRAALNNFDDDERIHSDDYQFDVSVQELRAALAASATDEPRLQMSCELATCDHECHDDPEMDAAVCDYCTGMSEQERATPATGPEQEGG